MIITEKEYESNNTCLKITFNSDITEDMGNSLPYPQKHFINEGEYFNQYVYYWYINGFFGTKAGLDFLNDIKARFLITYPSQIDKIRHFPTEEQANLHLKHFQGLKSKAVAIINKTSRYDNKADFIFWCLKLEAERLITERGQVLEDWLIDFGMVNFGSTSTKACKDASTLKSKCRSITRYYAMKNYQLDCYQKKYNTPEELEELKMNRTENAIRVSKEKKENNAKRIQNTLTGMFGFEYVKPNGKYNVSKLAKDLNLSRETITKHLKTLQVEQ